MSNYSRLIQLGTFKEGSISKKIYIQNWKWSLFEWCNSWGTKWFGGTPNISWKSEPNSLSILVVWNNCNLLLFERNNNCSFAQQFVWTTILLGIHVVCCNWMGIVLECWNVYFNSVLGKFASRTMDDFIYHNNDYHYSF